MSRRTRWLLLRLAPVLFIGVSFVLGAASSPPLVITNLLILAVIVTSAINERLAFHAGWRRGMLDALDQLLVGRPSADLEPPEPWDRAPTALERDARLEAARRARVPAQDDDDEED